MDEISTIEAQPRNEKKLPVSKKHPINLTNHICEHITTVCHFCIVAFTCYIFYLSIFEFDILFNWHPILFGIGWMLLMTEAILMITKDNIFSARLTHALRVRYHWVMQTVAVLMSLGGFIMVFIYKERENQAHFTTSHGIIGLISMILTIPVCLNGIAALFNIQLRKYIKPKINKLFHATTGILCVFVGGAAMVTSLYTGWFKWRTNDNKDIFILCYVAVVFGIAWSLVRPIITFIERLFSSWR